MANMLALLVFGVFAGVQANQYCRALALKGEGVGRSSAGSDSVGP
jgi:hypothetical protein